MNSQLVFRSHLDSYIVLCSENKMYVYYSYVYEMEKHSFPPTQALTLDVKCGEDLV